MHEHHPLLIQQMDGFVEIGVVWLADQRDIDEMFREPLHDIGGVTRPHIVFHVGILCPESLNPGGQVDHAHRLDGTEVQRPRKPRLHIEQLGGRLIRQIRDVQSLLAQEPPFIRDVQPLFLADEKCHAELLL